MCVGVCDGGAIDMFGINLGMMTFDNLLWGSAKCRSKASWAICLCMDPMLHQRFTDQY
ncbi:hypothetical protein HAX54_020697, partial [Datura stramonium]|nr:hypothetical protein [Datura stramonium]